jgi:HEAT repeat protein
MRDTRPCAFILFVVLLAGARAPAQQDEKPVYWSLIPEGSTAPSAHLVVRIAPQRAAPAEWEMDWHVALYSPKGHRLPLGYLKDRGTPDDESRLLLRLPPGTHRIEVTHAAPSQPGFGHFDLDKGKWVPPNEEPVFDARTDIALQPDQVRTLTVTYRNPRAMSKKEGDTTTRAFVWEAFALAAGDGSRADLPPRTPKPYPLTARASLAEVDVPHLVQAMKEAKDGGYAEQTILRMSRPPVAPIQEALKDGSLALTWRIARILVKAGDPGSVAALAAVLQRKGRKASERAAAAWALGGLGGAAAAEPLRAALRDPDVLVRIYAAAALGGCPGPGVVPALTEALKDTGALSRGSIFTTVEEAPQHYFFSQNQQSLLSIVATPHFSVRRNAVFALGQLRDPEAVAPLLALLESADEGDRIDAARSLGNYSGPKVVAALQARLTDRQSVRWLAVHILGRIGDAGTAAILDKLAKEDTDAMVREAATQAAANIRKRTQPPPAKKSGA